MKVSKNVALILGISYLFTACTGAGFENQGSRQESENLSTPLPTSTGETTVTPAEETSTPPSLVEGEQPPAGASREFSTDFSRHSIPYSEILFGGVPKDGIPPIDRPQFIDVDQASEWLNPVEPVVFVQVGEDARAYPLQILTWHEIVNDIVGGLPLVVTFCPLCNTAIAFERQVDHLLLDFGTTGRLRYSNLIMYDRQTETWWQQASGEAIAGELLGTQLAFYPAAILSWDEFRSAYPQGLVLSRETGFSRPYGENPYGGYDDVNNFPFLYRGPGTPDVLPAVARVLTVDLEEEAVAYPYVILEEMGVVNDVVAAKEIAIVWQPGTASALDAPLIADGRDIGAANAFSRQLDGRVLTFRMEGQRLLDDQTGSEWNLVGRSIAGELEGKQLEPVVAINHFWFSWAAFKPETRIYRP
jgi:hypothetical protein